MFLILKYYCTFVLSQYFTVKMYKSIFKILFAIFIFQYQISFSQNRDSLNFENGLYKSFYKNGKVMGKGHFKNFQKVGVWYFYDENNILYKKEKYQNGKIQWQLFFNKGKITKIIDQNGHLTERSKCGC